MASENGEIPNWESEKQYRQAVRKLLWSTIAINGFMNTFTQLELLLENIRKAQC